MTLAILASFAACNRSSGGRSGGGGPTATVTFPFAGTFEGDVLLEYTLFDEQSDVAFVKISYTINGGNTWRLATERPGPPSQGVTDLPTAPGAGVPHTFVWNSFIDLGTAYLPNVRLRVVPFDTRKGRVGQSGTFSIDNRNVLPLEVVEVSDSIQNTATDQVLIRFSNALDTTTVTHQGNQGANGDTFAVFRDTNSIPGGTFVQQVGTITFSAGDALATYTPPTPFVNYREVRIVLTNGIRDTGGNSLIQGTTVPSAPLSFTSSFPGEVFEIRFTPGVGPLTGQFVPDSGTDVWFYDFDQFGTFDSDLSRRGLRGASPLVAEYARDRVIGQILSAASEKYLRDSIDGSSRPGAYRISFVGVRPAGTLGVNYNRICVGLDLGGLWGAAWYDPGNTMKEDDCRTGNPPLGVFSGGIYGLDSVLSPGLAPSDLPYVDGSYVLGTSPGQDSRFTRVRDVIWDWGHALGVIGSHEIGHSVGLPHDDSNNLNIMRSWASQDHVSNPNVRFSNSNRNLLRSNLGQH